MAVIMLAGVEAIHRLGSCQACINSLQAAVGGDLASRMGHGGGGAATALLPLAGPPGLQPAEFSSPWLGDLLAALLERASVLGLGRAASVQPAEQQARDDQAMWEEAFAKLMGLVMSHVAVVLQVFRTAKAQGIVEGMQYARSVIPVKVVRAIILHCSETQRNELRSSLSELG